MRILGQSCLFLSVLLHSSALPAVEPPAGDCACSLESQVAAIEQEVVVCAEKPTVLLAGIGGWKSCLGKTADDQYISDRFFAMVKQIRCCRPDWNVDYVLYCSPGLKTRSECEHVKSYSNWLGAGSVAERNIGKSIERHKRTPDTKVFVMGHSHGGWMAMRAALCLGHVDGLFTLEPVSANQCKTRDYLKNRTRKIFKRKQKTVPGCRRAPTDVSHVAVLNTTGGNWTNFFLAPNTEKGDVYSSPIAVTHNHMIWAPAEGKYNAHHNLGLSAEVWCTIRGNILSHLDCCTSTILDQPAPPAATEVDLQLSTNRDSSEARVWRSKDLEQTQSGRLVDLVADVAFIQAEDGTRRSVSIEHLSVEDQAWIRNQVATKRETSDPSTLAALSLN